MISIHIPPEVIEAMTAARRKYLSTIEADTRIGELTDGEHADISADEIRAALRAWVECRMAKTTTAFQLGDGTWSSDSGVGVEDQYDFKAIIIRTEARK